MTTAARKQYHGGSAGRWTDPLEHDGSPECALCMVERGTLGAEAFRAERARARAAGIGRRAHEFGRHPLADLACAAADAAEDGHAPCYSGAGAPRMAETGGNSPEGPGPILAGETA